jgi:ribosomal protein S18 acetylase RimI-like enzyme
MVQHEEENLSLRGATTDDEPFLLELYASTRLDELAVLGWDDSQKQAFIRMQFLVRERGHSRASDRIVLLDSRPIGRILATTTEAAILLQDIALLPECRNAGIGSRLIQDLIKEAAAAGKSIQIHVVTTNPAVRLYERLGFRRSGPESAYETAYLEMQWVPAKSSV